MSTVMPKRPTVRRRQRKATPKFVPELVYFEPKALDYPKGEQIMEWVKANNIPYRMTTSHNRITNFPGDRKSVV